jgi:hypothetical protein
MSALGSGPDERSGAGRGGEDGRPPRSQAPLVQFPSAPLVQGPTSPRVDFSAAVDALAALLGLDPETHEGPCPLPGHRGRARLAADIPEDDTGDVRLLCCSGRWRSLGEVYAAIAFRYDNGGRPAREGGRSNIEIAVWTRRLGCDVGAFWPAAVAVPPLPSGASPAIERVWAGFRLLIGIRWADGPRVPVPYSARFAAAWCGVSRGAAHAAIRFLIERGVLCEVEQRGRLPLYLPGTIPEEGDEARANDEEALIARLIAEFDAVELPPDSPDDGEARP